MNVEQVKSDAKVRVQDIDSKGRSLAKGKRKASTAKAWVKLGSGEIKVNGIECSQYFDNRLHYIQQVNHPLQLFSDLQFDVNAVARGGGKTGHAGAIKLAISNALVKLNPEFYSILRSNGFMTCDSRRVLRKKAGFVKHSKRKPTSRR